jgi:hypothetical protein
LDWYQKPHKEAAVRGYIIKSRVRVTDNLLLATPYSPMLFGQGPPPGPLLEVLRGMPRKEALRQWTREEEAAEVEADARDNDVRAKWPFAMKLPCRHCEKEFAISKLTSASDFNTILGRGDRKRAEPRMSELPTHPGSCSHRGDFCM